MTVKFTETEKSPQKQNTTMKPGKESRLQKELYAFIPRRINNRMVVGAMEFMRRIQKLCKADFSENLQYNQEHFHHHEKTLRSCKGYVEDQNAYSDLKYGKSTMKISGCEVFAAYNAMVHLSGKPKISLVQMISAFEKDGMILSGKFGTSPKAIHDYFIKQGFESSFTANVEEFDSVGKENDTLILTIYNDKDDIRKEVHTVNISKEEGKYTAHNVYGNGKIVGPCFSVSEILQMIHHGKAKGIFLIGIRKK